MTINSFYNLYSSNNEQTVLDDLIIESIQIYGQNLYYLPRINESNDSLYGTSDIVTYKDVYQIEMYIKSIDGFGGDGNFLSKFGLEIRDQITFTVSKKRFEEEITLNNKKINRPREGDLIYFPMNKRLFEIKFADNKPTFYQMGTLQVYNLTCELYEYASERFETGIKEIDDQAKMYTQDKNANTIPSQDGFIDISFHNDDTQKINIESDKLIQFTDSNPFGEMQ